MRTYLLLSFVLFYSLLAQSDGLIISEYIEGSSNNKAIEIYNGTGSDIDLMNYAFVLFSNGRDTIGNNLIFDSSKILAAGATYVIANPNADAAILASSDTSSSLTFFNGDDDIAIMTRANFDSRTMTFIDFFGQRSVDPGSFYEGNSVRTQNKTLRRKSSITIGDSNDQDTFDPSVEWDQFDIDTFDGLGSHFIAGTGYGFTANPSAINLFEDQADISFSVSDSSTAKVYYGLTSSYSDSIIIAEVSETFLVNISGLTESTEYHYQVKVTKADLSESAESVDLTFSTTNRIIVTSVSEVITNFQNYDGQEIIITGTVLNDFGNIQTNRTNIFVVSNTGYSINLSSSTLYQTLRRGDLVQIFGRIGSFRKVIQIVPSANVTIISSGNPIPEPRKVSTEEVSNHSSLGQYVEVVGTVEDSYNTGSSGGNIEINDGSGTAVARVWATTGLSATSASIDQRYRLRGAIGTFVTGGDTIAQILPSVNSDIELFSNTVDDSGFSINSLKVEAMSFDIDLNTPVRFQFKLRENSRAAFAIYDMSGKRVKTLDSKNGTGNLQEATWNKLNNQYQKVRIGTYILYMEVTEENGKKISKHVPVVIGARL